MQSSRVNLTSAENFRLPPFTNSKTLFQILSLPVHTKHPQNDTPQRRQNNHTFQNQNNMLTKLTHHQNPINKPIHPPKTTRQTRTVQGHKDPLSNFFPFSFYSESHGHWFRSLEHLYQYQKAISHDCQHLAFRILQAPHAGVAKSLAREIPKISAHWIRSRYYIMQNMLHLKYNSCKIFRDTLMALPEDCHLSHTVPHDFWGVGRNGNGSDYFGQILSKIKRAKHFCSTFTPSNEPRSNPKPSSSLRLNPISTNNSFQPLSNPVSPSTTPSHQPWSPVSSTSSKPSNRPSPKPKRSSPSPSIPISTNNRFQPLSNPIPPPPSSPQSWSPVPTTPSNICQNTWPLPSANNPTPPRSNLSSTPLRRPRSPSDSPSDLSPSLRPKGKRTKFVAPKSTPSPSYPVSPISHVVDQSIPKTLKTHWTLPILTKSIAVIGGSNISRISHSPVEDIQLLAYHGVAFYNATRIFKKIRQRSDLPKSIILNIGTNNKDSDPFVTSGPEMSTMVSACSKAFPHSKIYLSKITFSAQLTRRQQNNLNALNNQMDKLKLKYGNLTVLEQLDPAKFRTGRDNIHWTAQTSDDMLAFWLSHLN